MPESYRGYFLAAGVAGFAAISLMGSAELRCQRDYYAEYAYYVHNDSQRSEPTRFDRGWLPCLVERVTANPDTDTANEHEQRDLIAQESTALWAFWMAFFSGLTALVTSVGTILIWKQISLTREAVDDTGRATAAMLDANRMSQLKDRAWIEATVEIAFGSIDRNGDGSLYLNLRLKNVGGTLASQLSVNEYLTSFNTPPESPADAEWTNIFPDLPQGGEWEQHFAYGVFFSKMDWQESPFHEEEEGLVEIAFIELTVFIRYKVIGDDTWHYIDQKWSIGDEISWYNSAYLTREYQEGGMDRLLITRTKNVRT